MRAEPPSAHAVRLRQILKSLLAATDNMVRETSADPNAGESEATREQAVDALLSEFKETAARAEAPTGETAVVKMGEVHARLERTFRLYLRAAAAGKHVARKEMRRVVQELKADSSWQ